MLLAWVERSKYMHLSLVLNICYISGFVRDNTIAGILSTVPQSLVEPSLCLDHYSQVFMSVSLQTVGRSEHFGFYFQAGN